MKYCVLNKSFRGITTNKELFRKIALSDLNSENYTFDEGVDSNAFLARALALDITGKRDKILNKFVDNHTIMYMTYNYVEKIGGHVFSFLIKEKKGYTYESHVTVLTRHLLQGFQEAYVRVMKNINAKQDVYLLTNQTTLIRYLKEHMTTLNPLKDYRISVTDEFIRLYKEKPLILTYIPEENLSDLNVLALLNKKSQLELLIKSTDAPNIRRALSTIDRILVNFTRVPILINSPQHAFVNTYKEFLFKIKEPIQIEKEEFVVKTTKLETFMETANKLATIIENQKEEQVAPEESSVEPVREVKEEVETTVAEEILVAEIELEPETPEAPKEEPEEDEIDKLFSDFNSMLEGN